MVAFLSSCLQAQSRVTSTEPGLLDPDLIAPASVLTLGGALKVRM